LDNELFLIDSLKLSNKKEIERRKSQAQADYKKNAEEINLKYDEQIAAIEAEANEYKLQLAEYDTAKIESAKEQEKKPIRNRNSQSASFLTPLHFYIQSPFRPGTPPTMFRPQKP
jgi:hypothetical protein